MSHFFFDGADGTRLRGWRNDGKGSPVVLVTGLGGMPEAFPSLTDPSTGLAVHSFAYRGTYGSDRPRNPAHVRLSDHAGDVVRLMDAEGLPQAVLVGSGYGVQVVFEVLRTHPERVHAVVGLAGLPRFTGVEPAGSLAIHEKLLLPVTSRVARGVRRLAPAIGRSGGAEAITSVLLRTRLISSRTTSKHLTPTLRAMGKLDSGWLQQLMDAAEQCELDPSAVTVPVTFVHGDTDSVVSRTELRDVIATVPKARAREVHGGSILGLEQPAIVLEEVLTTAQEAGLNPMEFLERD